MRIFVVVNRVSEIGPRQTTAMLIAGLIRAGHTTSLVEVQDISGLVSNAGLRLIARSIVVSADCVTPQAVADNSVSQTAEPVVMTTDDVILIRTNPGRDKERARHHVNFLNLCQVAERCGTRVFNSPSQLEYFASKASLLSVDACFVPASLLSSDEKEIADFVRSFPGGCVLKPTSGSRGEGVVRLHGGLQDLEFEIQKLVAQTTVIAQEFVSQSEPGDKRVIVLDGEVLEMNGHPAGIERRPAEGDFRANLHAGGTAYPLMLSAAEFAAATFAAKLLCRNKIRLAGVDLVGERIIEFNVFSTGGLFDAERFTGCHFVDTIVQQIFGELTSSE